MSKAVIVFSFPEPENPNTLGSIITTAKEVFTNMPDVKIHMAIKEAADNILTILEPGE